jgi:DNA repair protein RadC
MKIKNVLKEERPRERLIKHGSEVLSSAELLAIILREGSKKENVVMLANRILAEYNFDELSRLRVDDLKKIFGIGEAKACQIIACFELGRRANAFIPEKRKIINSAHDIYKLFFSMGRLKKENFKVIFLDSRKKIINDETIFVGSLNASVIHPREVFDLAIRNNAAAVILVHNHPSGDSSPSDEDLEITKQLISSGKILDIEVLDHVIIGNNNYYSLREKEDLWN